MKRVRRTGTFGTAGPEDVIEDLSEPIAFAKLMEKSGIDFINVSAGSAAGNLELRMPTVAYPEGVYRHFGWTRIIKSAVSIPVIGSGYSRLKNGDDSLHVADRRRRALCTGRNGTFARGTPTWWGWGGSRSPIRSSPARSWRVASGT